jgi:glycosyltransferase involved in cell wall biosynthesis
MLPRIILVTSMFTNYGGAEHALLLLACALKRRGHEVAVVMRSPVNRAHPYYQALRDAEVPLIALPALRKNQLLKVLAGLLSCLMFVPYLIWRWKSLPESWRSVASITESLLARTEERIFLGVFERFKKADVAPLIVHIFGPDGLVPLLTGWGRQNGVPVVYTECAEANEQCVRDYFMKWTLEVINDIPLIICCAERVANNIRSTYGYRGPIEFLPFLIAEPKALSADDGEAASKAKQTIRLGTVGRLIEAKGHQNVIWALAELRKRGLAVELVLAGNGPMREALETQATQLGVGDAVRFLGNFKEISEVMAQIDIFVLASLSESQPLVVSEAMAYGKPVVASNCGGLPDWVEAGKSGFLIQPGKREELLPFLERLITDHELRRRMGERGRAIYQERQATDVVLDKMEAIYASLVSGSDYPHKAEVRCVC